MDIQNTLHNILLTEDIDNEEALAIKIYELREEMLEYFNKNAEYNYWEVNDIYDNCIILENDDGEYIEIFVHLDTLDSNPYYTINEANTKYETLEDVNNNKFWVNFDDEDFDDEDFEAEGDYFIKYGRGDVVFFDTIEEAKEWQVANIWEDNYEDYAQDDPTDETNPVRYDWEEINEDSYLLEFVMFDKNNEKYDTDTSDGAGWFIQKSGRLNEDKEEIVSANKQKFIDFCSNKIEDLGDIMIDEISYHIIMHTEGIREFSDLRIIADLDNYEFENLVAINKAGAIVINTPMIDYNEYAASMQFDKIDQRFYDSLMNYWDDLNMDERIEDESEE